MKSWKHSSGTEYLRSAVEYFVRNEITIFLPSTERLSALSATTLTRVDCFSCSLTA